MGELFVGERPGRILLADEFADLLHDRPVGELLTVFAGEPGGEEVLEGEDPLRGLDVLPRHRPADGGFVQIEHVARLLHRQRLEIFHSPVEKIALGADDDVGNPHDGALAQIQCTHELARLLEFFAQIGAVLGGEVRIFQQFEIAFREEKFRQAVPPRQCFVGAVLLPHDRHLRQDEFGIARGECRTGERIEFAQLRERRIQLLHRDVQSFGQLGQPVAGDVVQVMLEEFRQERRERFLSFELEPQTLGEVAAADPGRVEPLNHADRLFGFVHRGVGTHGQIRRGRPQITGVVDAANRLFGQFSDARRQRREGEFGGELVLQRRSAGEGVEHILLLFAGGAVLSGAGRHRQFVGPLFGWGWRRVPVTAVPPGRAAAD